tara:strand:- start:554 stop:739 length:186 start_codon:yes stop_codon:yes gene_type:complete
MKYLVNYMAYGKTKNKIIEAITGKEAESVIKEEYPNCEILRITSNTEHIKHYESIKKMRKK